MRLRAINLQEKKIMIILYVDENKNSNQNKQNNTKNGQKN